MQQTNPSTYFTEMSCTFRHNVESSVIILDICKENTCSLCRGRYRRKVMCLVDFTFYYTIAGNLS